MKRYLRLPLLAVLLYCFSSPAHAIDRCGSGKRVTCVVDGDTMWYRGEKIRMQGYDAPETTTNICGGNREVRLGQKATTRLIQLLNQGGVTFRRTGKDKYDRTLAVISIGGKNVGDILIAEGLARRWPDGPEFWCH